MSSDKNKNNSPDLSIVILSYNSAFWLKKTLTTLKESYLKKTNLKIKIIAVDNNSSDESTKLVKKSFRFVELIELDKNNGFAAGNNVALKKLDTKYGMLLNSDVEFLPSSNLDVLIDYLENHEDVGVITPRLEFTNGQIDPACHRGEPSLWPSIAYFLKLEKLFPKVELFSGYHQYYKDLSTIHEIDACSGAALIFRTNLLKKVGYLDERFFMYAEDLDWCKRFRNLGYKIIYYPFVSLIHHKNKSGFASKSKKTASKTKSYFYDTMLEYYDKHYHSTYPKWVRNIIKYIVKLKSLEP